VLGHSALSAGPLASTLPFVPPQAIQPPSISSGGALGFAAMSSGPVSAISAFEPIAGIIAGLVEAASAADITDAAVVPATIIIGIGGGRTEPLPVVEGYGLGILPALWGEGRGVVLPPAELDDLELLLLLLAA